MHEGVDCVRTRSVPTSARRGLQPHCLPSSFASFALGVSLQASTVTRTPEVIRECAKCAQLEGDLGVRLLQRTTRKLCAHCPLARRFYESVSGSVSAIDDADASARERGNSPRGVVRVSAPPDFGAIGLAVARFARKYPSIRVELSISSRRVDLVSEGFDLAIRGGKLDDSSLVAKRIGNTEMSLFASTAYLRRRGRPKTIDDLAVHDWVLYRATAGRSVIRLTGPEGERSVEVTGIVIADDMTYCCAVRWQRASGSG